MGQHEAADFTVEREHVHAVADGQHQRGLRAVHGIAGGDLLGAGLHEIGFRHGFAGLGHVQHREDGADRHIHVDVGRAVERIEQQQVFALRVAMRNLIERFHLFRGHGGQVAAVLVGFEQDFVGDHIQLLLGFALHVAGAGRAEHAGKGPLVDAVRDRLAGAGHDFEQQTQLGRDGVVLALLFDQVAGEVDALHGFS